MAGYRDLTGFPGQSHTPGCHEAPHEFVRTATVTEVDCKQMAMLYTSIYRYPPGASFELSIETHYLRANLPDSLVKFISPDLGHGRFYLGNVSFPHQP